MSAGDTETCGVLKKAELGAGYFLMVSLESSRDSIRRVGRLSSRGTNYRWSGA